MGVITFIKRAKHITLMLGARKIYLTAASELAVDRINKITGKYRNH